METENQMDGFERGTAAVQTGRGAPEHPLYTKVLNFSDTGKQQYSIICDEGEHLYTVCTGMTSWAADWLLDMLGNQPYGDHRRPRGRWIRRVETVRAEL